MFSLISKITGIFFDNLKAPRYLFTFQGIPFCIASWSDILSMKLVM